MQKYKPPQHTRAASDPPHPPFHFLFQNERTQTKTTPPSMYMPRRTAPPTMTKCGIVSFGPSYSTQRLWTFAARPLAHRCALTERCTKLWLEGRQRSPGRLG